MNVIAHALLPALLATPLLPRRSRREHAIAAAIVAMGGALPDLLNPHLSLAARYSSWSHTVFAWTAFAAAMLGLAWWPRLRTWRIPLLLAAPAYALHLAADAVSGGIVWLHPLSDAVVGTRLIRYRWWWPIDGALVALATVFFASWPAWRRAQPAALRTETLP